MANTMQAQTFDKMTLDDRWLGFGYIGGRNNAITEGWDVTAADELALSMANDAGLTYDEFFTWANSKDARWFADCALGCNDLDMARRYGPRKTRALR